MTLCNPMDCSMPGFPVTHHLPEFAQLYVHCTGDAFFSFYSWSFPASGTFPMSHLLMSDDRNTAASASVLLENIQGWSPLRLTVLISCSPRDFRESSLPPQFKSINSLEFCLHYGPALTTVCDHWEDHSLDYTDLCQQNNVSGFQHTI